MTKQTLGGAIDEALARWSERPALVFRGRTTTYAELARAVRALSAAYRHLGIERGDRIICRLPNCPELLTAAAAAWASAAVHVGADHDLTGSELSEYVRLTGAKALLYSPSAGLADPFLPLREVRDHHPDVHMIVAGATVPEGARSLSELMDGASDCAPRGRPVPDISSPDEIAAIFTTSGTTGKPKMPLGYHGKLFRSWTRLAEGLAFGSEDVHLVQLPMAHGFGLMLATAGLIAGGRLVLVERFSADEGLALIGRERVTVLNGSPTHFRLLLDRLEREPYDVSTLRIGVASGAGFSPSLLRSIFDKLAMNLMLMYGSSEGVGVVTTDPEEMLSGSVGKPDPGSVEIVGADRRPVPAGEVGEIAFSREVFPVRYWRQPDEASPAEPTAEEVSTGWYYSGDLGRFDNEGRLYVVGRLKHQINRGGLKVDPVEVEEALNQCASVADAAVLGMPNPVLGEVVCACIVPRSGHAPMLKELRSDLGRILASHKLPDELCVLDHIPRTGLGKIDLELLRAEVVASPQRQRLRR